VTSPPVKPANRNYRRGASRERDVKAYLEEQGYVVFRVAGSKAADLIALGGGSAMIVEVKSSGIARGPFADFGPAERIALLELGRRSGAAVMLAWWPRGGRDKLRLIPPAHWPDDRAPRVID
jgi:Holliday junction resolvase